MKEDGFVYILTNPSFKEDWVKIGMSSRPVNIRSKELDNTAVPLPFSIYATLKTTKYIEAERHVHLFLDQFTDRRIRRGREFFNVTPEEALRIFINVASLLDDAEICLYKDNIPYPYEGHTTIHSTHRKRNNADNFTKNEHLITKSAAIESSQNTKHRGKTKRIVIYLPDNMFIDEEKGAIAFSKAIQIAGASRVESLGYTVDGFPMVSKLLEVKHFANS